MVPPMPKTVFILGAGASSPYGFPLGSDLKHLIRKHSDANIIRLVSPDLAKRIPLFKKSLKYGTHETIDYFLDQMPSYRELGAYYIATVIGTKEREQKLFPEHDIYSELYRILDLHSEKESIPPISIVTLNYDRSLEYFLENNIKWSCPEGLQNHAVKKLSDLEIIHAHGTLGSLSIIPFGEVNKHPDFIQSAVITIRITFDSFEDSEAFRTAQETIAKAHKLVFLGFGYHKRTISSLLVDANIQEMQVYGTAKGLSSDRRQEVLTYFGESIHLGGSNDDSVRLLKDIGING